MKYLKKDNPYKNGVFVLHIYNVWKLNQTVLELNVWAVKLNQTVLELYIYVWKLNQTVLELAFIYET
jgi:hypothetical protein